jgi:hypothetical protein
MTQDEIIEMARQAGWKDMKDYDLGMNESFFIGKFTDLKAFAKLVAQHERERIKQANAPEIERVNAHIRELEDAVLAEREACALLCEELKYDGYEMVKDNPVLARKIRARGQA